MAIYFFDKNQTLIKIAPDSATFEAIQTQELDDDSLLKDTLSVTAKGDEKLLNAEYMAVKSYTGNAQTFDMYSIVTDTTPDKSMSFTGMSLAPYELNGHIIQDLRPANQTISYTLNRVLDGTDWRVGYIEDGLSNVTTTFYYVSAKEALKELQSLVGCEFVFKVEISGQKITDKWIEVYKEMGNRTKKRFNYGTNALTVIRETNKADIYTALIGRGKGEEVSSGEDNASGQAGYGRKITFEDIEWSTAKGNPLDKPKGQYYLELPQATQVYGIKNIDGTMSARIGIVDFDDEEDKNRLINLTYQQLLVSSRPKVLFKTTVANVGATGIGDTVTIHRHDLNIHYQTRVRKIVRNKLNDNKTQIELGDAVVTPSTKQAKQNNAIIQNLNQEIEKVKADVTVSQTSADGKNTIFYGSEEPTRKHTGDTWYRPHPSIAGETQMLVWNGTAWELVLDTSDLTSVSRAVEDAANKADEAVQAAKDADARANSALEKAGANANLLTTHQNTLNTINTVTLPDIASTAGTALADAKSAMDEAKKADGKIADYVTKKGLVNGTTVDSKINTATGEISRKITTVESKIPTEIGGRNLILDSGKEKLVSSYSTGHNDSSLTIPLVDGETYTLSFDAKTDEPSSFTKGLFINNGTNGVEIKPKMTIDGNYSRYTSTFVFKDIPYNNNSFMPHLYPSQSGKLYIKNIKLEKGSIPTDWSPAPEDNLSQSEFQIFESTYDEDVKGINSTLTDLTNKKLDGTTYQNFYNNEYKRTAQGVTDTWEAVNKVIDENGNSTDAFAQAVYEINATRQSADFKNVTKDLVKTATYTAGINGVKQSITKVEGKIDGLQVGGRNLLLKSSDLVLETKPRNTGAASDNYNFTTLTLNLKKGTQYTLSFELEKLGLDYSSVSIYTQYGHVDARIINLTNSPRQYITFTAVADTNTNITYIYAGVAGSTAGRGIRLSKIKLEKGTTPTDWSPAPEDMLGKETFTLFKNDYDETSKGILSRLTAIDSSAEGSVVTRLNKTESTASENVKLISTINKNYVTQKAIDESILSDKQVKDTRNDNQPPSWYYANYPRQTVKEFKFSSVMGVGADTYGLLTTDVQWDDSSGGTVKQQFATSGVVYNRVSNYLGTAWLPWAKQLDTADKTYQKVVERSNLYERVIGSASEDSVKQNVARIVMTDSLFQTKVYDIDNGVANNLLRNAELKNIDYWTAVLFRLSGTGGFLIDQQANLWGHFGQEVSVSGGEVVSASLDIRLYGGDNSSNQYFELNVFNEEGKQVSNRIVKPNLSKNWGVLQTLKIEGFKLPDTARKLVFTYAQNGGRINGSFSKPMLNIGYTVKPFSPSMNDKANYSEITQLADNINLKVSKSDLISQINVQAGGVLIQSGTNKLNITPTTTYIQDATIKSGMIQSLLADKITAGTLNASKVKVINLDANNITANKTSFVQSAWNGINNTVSINANGIRSANTKGDWTLYHSGAISFGNSSSQGIYLEYTAGVRNGIAINNRGALNTEITLDLMSSARNTLNFGRRTDTNGYDFRIDHYQGTKVSFDGRGVSRYTFNVNSDAQSHAISILGHGATSGYNKGSGLSIGMETADGRAKGSRFYFSSNSDLVWLGKDSYGDLKPLAVSDLQFRWGTNGRKSLKDVLEYLSRASGVDINNIPDV